jgi:copper homeostasis protein
VISRENVLDERRACAYRSVEHGGAALAHILLEIIASTVDDCLAAESGGADRIELCAAITTGGLTPSLGTLIEARKRVRIPVMAMVRPRAAGFCYSDGDFNVMQRDVALLLEHGADGIVFGILGSDGSVDIPRCRKILELADGKQTVFHRAFDVVLDAHRALDELIDAGLTRVLTSGRKKAAVEGRNAIRDLIARAGERIEILVGGGVRPHNVQQLVEESGCTQVHLTAFSAHIDPSTSATTIRFGSIPGSPASSYELVDRKAVQRMRKALDTISSHQAEKTELRN